MHAFFYLHYISRKKDLCLSHLTSATERVQMLKGLWMAGYPIPALVLVVPER